MSEQPTPYEEARKSALLSMRYAEQSRTVLDDRGRPVNIGGDYGRAAIAGAIIALAEAIRPQPAQVNVTVTDAVVEAVAEAVKPVTP